MYELPHELPNDLRLTKSLKCFELMASTKPVTQKANFDSCDKNLPKISCKTFYRKSILLKGTLMQI